MPTAPSLRASPQPSLPLPLLLLLLLPACGGEGASRSTPIAGADVPPQLLACRARFDEPFRFAEIALRDGRNLGSRRVGDRTGTERGVRVHPDGKTVVFARERDNNDPDSVEIFTSTIDGSRGEVRLTQDTTNDGGPCWSPVGDHVLFASERGGNPRLWIVGANGEGAAAFRAMPTGTGEREPDWHRGTDRVVWSERSQLDNRWFLNSANGSGAAAGQLTQPPALAAIGDTSPRFTPDGSAVVFVRRAGADNAALCRVTIATGAVDVLYASAGDVATPAVAPSGDRVLFGLAEPLAGRAGLRLASVPIAGGTPTLLWPDERWLLEGVDVLPSLPAARVQDAPRTLDVLAAQVQIATATSVFGALPQLLAVDDDEFALTSANVEGRQIAAISLRFDLPVTDATDVEELRVRIVLRASRADGDSLLRTSLYNPVDERFDTVVERAAATTATTLEFRTSSLRHVTAEKQVRFTAVADLAPGDRADLFIDLAELVLVSRAN